MKPAATTEIKEAIKTEGDERKTTEKWLARKLEPVIAHELGHCIMALIQYPESRCTCYLAYTAQEIPNFVDPKTKETGTMRVLKNCSGKTIFETEKREGLKKDEKEKLVSASGVATETLIKSLQGPLANLKLSSAIEPTDIKAFDGNEEEFATYLTRARAILEPYSGMISHVAQRMARDVAESWGLGSYVLAISDRDIMRYLEGESPVIRNQIAEKIAELYERVAQSPNPINSLKTVIYSDEDPLPMRVPNEWLKTMEDYLHDDNPEIRKVGNIGLNWYLMRQIPHMWSRMKILDIDPQEFFGVCILAIQETIADEKRPVIVDGARDPQQLFYLRARRSIELALYSHIAEEYGIKPYKAPFLTEAARIYYLLKSEVPSHEDLLLLKTLVEERGLAMEELPKLIRANLGKLNNKHERESATTDPTYEQASQNLMREAVRQALDTLEKTHPREAKVLRAYYGVDTAPLSVDEIAYELGQFGDEAKQHVVSTKASGLRKLRNPRFYILRE